MEEEDSDEAREHDGGNAPGAVANSVLQPDRRSIVSENQKFATGLPMRLQDDRSNCGEMAPAPASGLLEGDAFDRDALALAEQSAGVGVWSIDLTTQRVRATAQFFRIMGLEPTSDSIPVEVVRALRHPDDRERVLAGFRRALEQGTDAYEIEYRIIRPDGNPRWIFGRGRVIRDSAGQPTRYSGVDLDITDRKATEAALHAARLELERMNQVLEQRVRERTQELEAEAARRAEAEALLYQAQKLEAVGRVAGGIAHDFNNVLQVIHGNLEIIGVAVRHGAGGTVTDDQRSVVERAVARALRAATGAKQLVSRLLAFGRQQPLSPTAVDLNALVGEMADMVECILGGTIRAEVALDPRVGGIYADRPQLEGALLNLVVNSRDAMPDGGKLVVATAAVDLDERGPGDLPPGRYALLSVSDTGCGIPGEHLQRVFEPFFTTKDMGKGSGFGLSTVYAFVRRSGGHVQIHSEVGAGTTVQIFLPRLQGDDAAEHAEAPAGAEPPRAARDETILLVEDDEGVRRFGAAALQGLGYRVVEAADAASALRILDTPDAQRIDLLFTDVMLPGGMNGPDLAEAVRQKRPGLSVLFASAYAGSAVARDGSVEAYTLLGKPYSIGTLAVGCRRAIDAARRDSAR
jgi:PAS domain S-box-containing protein